MQVALVHDDLMQWGGAERVLLALSELFPEAPIYTTVYNDKNLLLSKHFTGKKIYTSFLQKIPGVEFLYKTLLPLYPLAFEQFDFSGFDLVVSQTTRFAKAVNTKPGTLHICYCHTPTRFLWHLPSDKVNPLLNSYFSYLRVMDQLYARRVDFFIAGSVNASQRIKKIYKRPASVVQPFVDIKQYQGIEAYDGGYFLIISRLNSYKKIDLAIEAFVSYNYPLKIIGIGPEFEYLKERVLSKKQVNISFLGNVSEELRINLLAGCKALILPGEEDFGITPLEAQAFGKPVIAYGKGGALETVQDGVTGLLFNEQTPESLLEATERLENSHINRLDCIQNAARFSKEVFMKKFKKTVDKLSGID